MVMYGKNILHIFFNKYISFIIDIHEIYDTSRQHLYNCL